MKKGQYDPHKTKEIRHLYYIGNIGAAIIKSDEYLLEYPTDTSAILFKAFLLYINNSNEEANELINHALVLPMDNNTYIYAKELLVKIYLSEGKESEAINLCLETINSCGLRCVKIRKLLSSIYLEHNRFKDAYDIVTLPDFNCIDLNISRAHVLIKEGHYDRALKELDSPCIGEGKNKNYNYDEENNNNKMSILCYHKGNICMRLNMYLEAIDYFRKSLEKNCKKSFMFDIYCSLISAYYQMGDYFNSIALCNSIIKNALEIGKAANIYSLMGMSYIKGGNINKFEEVVNSISDKKIKDLSTVQILITKYKFMEALEIISKYQEDEYNVLYYKLQILFRLDRYEEFMVLFDRFKKLFGDDTSASLSDVERMKYYMEVKRGISIDKASSYTDRLFLSYDESIVREHIKMKHIDSKYGVSFKSSDDVDELFDYVKTKLDSSYKICDGVYDKYYVKVDKERYDNNGNLIKAISVTCFADTFNIITMYLVDNFDFNVEMPKVKKQRLSQIDKFNKRFGQN